MQAWREFLALRSEGQCRAVGVSNYNLADIDELTKETGQTPAVNQVQWSPSRHDPMVFAGLRERGVAVEGYSPLKSTRLRDRTLREIASGAFLSAGSLSSVGCPRKAGRSVDTQDSQRAIVAHRNAIGKYVSTDGYRVYGLSTG